MEPKTKKQRSLYIPYAGPVLLEFPLLNKGSAFSMEERRNFNLLGLLPEVVETIEEQAERAWIQYQGFKTEIDKHIYLRNIQDTNETLFYRLVNNHLDEMMPVIYTPTVGAACERFSEIYRRSRGVFISYQNRHNMDDILQNVPNHNIKVIVVTDGERILGLGDQGIGGMGIPIGKLSLYTACGGISPAYTLPVVLDVGTNNQQLLNDPLYMGWRNPRITDDEYYEFVDEFIQAVKQRWPDVLLQFEDFAQKNAMPLLNRCLPWRRFSGMRHCRNDHRPDPARRIKRGSSAAESLYGRSLWPADGQDAEPAAFPDQTGAETRKPQ